jgi:2-keto-3-deoxy-L-rhamnonate aldolase RhmA
MTSTPRNRLRELIASGDSACGVFATLTDPAVLEIIALSGADFALVDLEHAPIGLETLTNHVRAARSHHLATLVRVEDCDPKGILRVLETGADGILVPHVDSVETALEAIEAVRYPPLGHRGFYDGTAAANYFAHGFESYGALASEANRSVVLGLLIEDESGVESCGEFVGLPGVDIIFVGPADLGFSLGCSDTPKAPLLISAVDRVRRACRSANVAFCAPAGHPLYGLTAAELLELGDRFVLGGSDVGCMLSGLRAAVAQMTAVATFDGGTTER